MTRSSVGGGSTAELPLVDAIAARRSRRFALGMEIPSGPLAFRSRFEPAPLDEAETAMLVAAAAGVTGHALGIPFSSAEPDALPRHPVRLTGRTTPTPAGFATGDLFYTDDEGVWFVGTRDLDPAGASARSDAEGAVEMLRAARRQVDEGRLRLRREPPDTAEHNHWHANRPGTLLLMPVIDLAQQMLAYLSVIVEAGYSLYDDLADEWAGNQRRFWASGLLDRHRPMPLSEVEHYVLAMGAGEVGMSCFSASLMQQALGLGGVVFTGLAPRAVLGAGAADGYPALGFRFAGADAAPQPVGLDGVYEAFCPPFTEDMHDAVDRLVERKFGSGGTYRPEGDGPFRGGSGTLAGVEPPSPAQVAAVATMAQHVFDRHGRFPALHPPVFLRFYCQSHHLDLEFYERHYREDALTDVHRRHWSHWHPGHLPTPRPDDKEPPS